MGKEETVTYLRTLSIELGSDPWLRKYPNERPPRPNGNKRKLELKASSKRKLQKLARQKNRRF